jgi:HlyD family secretion protein
MTEVREGIKLESPPDLTAVPFKEQEKQAQEAKRRPTRWLMGLLLLGVLSGGGYLTYRQVVLVPRQEARDSLQTVAVERVTLPIAIAANGTVQPKQSTNVSPKTSGRLKSLTVDEGDAVQAGQILAYMDDSNLQGQLLQAKGELAAAQANLQKVVTGNRPQEIAQTTAQLKNAEATLRQAESDLQRNQQLYNVGAISAQALDTARTTRDTAQAGVEQAQQATALSQAGSRQEDIDQARAQVTQAQGALETIQTQVDDAVIRAPFSGIVTTRYADPGDFVAPATSASDTSSASTYEVEANVAERDISKIKVGQPVTLKADAYADQTFTGKVAQIAAQATVTTNVTSFKVKVSILSDSKRLLRPGMNVDAEFQVGKLDDALAIPTVAIVRQQGGEGVLVKTATGRPRFTPIQTGVTVGNQTEVRSGLTGNEQILISAPSQSSGSQSGRLPIPGLGGGSRSGGGNASGARPPGGS